MMQCKTEKNEVVGFYSEAAIGMFCKKSFLNLFLSFTEKKPVLESPVFNRDFPEAANGSFLLEKVFVEIL